MGKKKDKKAKPHIRAKIHSRKITARDKQIFEKYPRQYSCLALRERYQDIVSLSKLNRDEIRYVLGINCKTIEHQIIALRKLTKITKKNLNNRREITRYLVDCLHKHHDVIYEAILFGSSINGLGFSDSDLDLRLRPLVRVGHQELEPIHFNQDFAERALRDIAFQTTKCAPAQGNFVPSSRCPIAKLTLYQGDPRMLNDLREGVSYDISLSSAHSLGSFNSQFMQFLCKLSPKFHLLAIVIRYWSKIHKLIVSGYLSSYALVNMLIVFCQSLDKPLLPTVDQMREVQIAREKTTNSNGVQHSTRAVTKLEWQCLVCFDIGCYAESENKEPLAVLLLKFFEFYLKLDYSDKIITTRSGRTLSSKEFRDSDHYHPRFPIKEFLNIQDPFDLKHNLTSGMNGEHFNRLMLAISRSYVTLSRELLNNFFRPKVMTKNLRSDNEANSDELHAHTAEQRDWGLNAIFVEET